VTMEVRLSTSVSYRLLLIQLLIFVRKLASRFNLNDRLRISRPYIAIARIGATLGRPTWMQVAQ
jgi:hypothetical protein